MSLTKGPGIDGRDLPPGGKPRFGVSKPPPAGMVSTMPFAGDGITPFPEVSTMPFPGDGRENPVEDRRRPILTREELEQRVGKPTIRPGRKGPPKKRGGSAKGKSLIGKVGPGIGAAAVLAASAYGASRYNNSSGITPEDVAYNRNQFNPDDPFRS